MSIDALREERGRVCARAPEWDGRVAVLHVTEAGERALQVRALVSAADAGRAWELRCRVREAMVAFVQREYPQFLPRIRSDSRLEEEDRGGAGPDRRLDRASGGAAGPLA